MAVSKAALPLSLNKQEVSTMRRIAVGFLGLLLTVGVIGCEGDTTTDEPVAPATDGTTADPVADPATDADADGDVNAVDEEPADPAVE